MLFWICTSPVRLENLSLKAKETQSGTLLDNPVLRGPAARQEQQKGLGANAQGGNR